jgi:hypothetical protein
MKVVLDRVESNGRVMPKWVLDQAIILAQASVDDWTRNELEAYAFDRICDEICMQLLGE